MVPEEETLYRLKENFSEVCSHTSYSEGDNQLNEQLAGVVMGNSVDLVITNYDMEAFKETVQPKRNPHCVIAMWIIPSLYFLKDMML